MNENIFENIEYLDILDNLYNLNKECLDFLRNKHFLITGITGMIGSALSDFLMYLSIKKEFNIKVTGISRSLKNIENRFKPYFKNSLFDYYIGDLSSNDFNMETENCNNYDFIIHAASNSSPYLYSTDPVGTMLTNFLGMNKVLEISKESDRAKLVFISSGEVYGRIKKKKYIEETNYGYVDNVDIRSCYPNSKRATETLGISYSVQYNKEIIIARPSHVYGPTMIKSDTRAISSFIRNASKNEKIIMKSSGDQIRNYIFVFDAVMAIIKLLHSGVSRNAYNISNIKSIISIRDLAKKISDISGTELIMTIPDKEEKRGFTKLNYQVLDNDKIKKLGWEPIYSLDEGLRKTVLISSQISNKI